MHNINVIPFYLDNNSSCMPFYLLNDVRGNDVIYIGKNNLVYLNDKDYPLSYQILLYQLCLDKGLCFAYKINDNTTLLKKQKDNKVSYSVLNNATQKSLYKGYFDNLEQLRIHFNDKYICLTSTEYGDYYEKVIAGYDIEKAKLLDCNDYKTSSQLYEALVENRRCRDDLINSILKEKVLIKDKSRLYNFLSFILNEEINDKNVLDALTKAKSYVLERYPEVLDINKKEDKNKDKENDIKFFQFNRIPKKISNLKYKENKVYCKKLGH